MKRIINSLLLALVVLSMNAQQFTTDSDVKIGKLKNGLTYYIRHNPEPKQRAYFYIAQKVGAIQEEPNQRGLAHFLEHMCFNGTKHFPGTSLRSYLEKIGVKFGADLNAYTAVDETVYNIDNVPTTVNGAIDSCLWILHDWSNDLTLNDKEINDERGVIHEEWRMRNSSSQRMNEAMMPVILAGSKYADAMPIGNMDIVMHFKPQTLRRYYEKWYRPDLQGIIIVGDIDVAQMEAKIKKIFSDIPAAPMNKASRIYYPVPDNKEPIFFADRDKELSSSNVVMYFKHDVTKRDDKNSRDYMVHNLFNNFFYEMFHDHTRDIAQKPDSPFALAYIRDGDFFLSNTKRALSAIVSCKDNRNSIMEGSEAMLRELFRIRQNGFTQSEFDRYRKDMLVHLDNMLEDKNKRESSGFVNEYVRNFLDNEPIPRLEDEVSFWKKELPKLTVADLNNYFRSLFKGDDSNIVITITAPEADTINVPSKQVFMEMYKKVEAEKIAPYIDNVSNLPFLPVEPVAGTIISETTDSDGRIHMTLSNGAKVVVMKTDYKKNEILMQAFAHGGLSLIPAEQYKYSTLISGMTAISGWGNYSLADMSKKFVGINANINVGIEDNYQSVAGSCLPVDIKYMLEMTHASFLYPHKDSEAFASFTQRLKRTTLSMDGKPEQAFSDSLQMITYGKSPYNDELKAEEYDSINYDTLLNIYKQRFSDASNFTFTFVGNVNIDSLRPYLEKYIASLPSTYKHEQARSIHEILPGSRSCIFYKEQQTPKATISLQYVAPGEFNVRNQIVGSILGQVLTIIYTKTIREDAGAAYSVSAGCAVDYYPNEQNRIIVRFPTSPQQSDLAISLVDKGLDELVKNGPSQTDVDKVKEYMLKVHQSNQTSNRYWQYVMSFEWNHGYNLDKDYDNLVRSITVKDVQNMAKSIKAGDRLLVVMSSPEKK